MVMVDDESLMAQGLCGVMEKALIAQGISPTIAATLASRACEPVVGSGIRKGKRAVGKAIDAVETKVKRKASKYQKRVGVELKKLKKKHPRTPMAKLMKRAHRLAKKAMS